MTAQLAKTFSSSSKRDSNGTVLLRPFSDKQAGPTTFFPGGSEIYGQGERAGSIYQVEFGCVRIHRLMADGRRQIAAFYMAGEVFGFEVDSSHQFFAEAVCSTGVRTMRMTPAVAKSPSIVPLALESLAHAQRHLLVLGRQNASERVAAFLIDMAERQGDLGRIELPMSRSDIADYLGLTVETVSRVFTKYRQEGLIRLVGSREIEVLNGQALASMTE